MEKVRVLLIEDRPSDAVLIRKSLAGRTPVSLRPGTRPSAVPTAVIAGELSFEVVFAECLRDGRTLLRDEPVDVVLLDLGLPDSEGLASLRDLCGAEPGVPIIVLTGADESLGPAALREGAQDFLEKEEISGPVLIRSIRYAIERHHANGEVRRGAEQLRQLTLELEERVVERTAQLERWTDQLRQLAVQLTEAEQRERRRLSRILHDGLQQSLVAVRMHLNRVHHETDDERRSRRLKEVDELLRKTIRSSRSFAIDLSPPVLQDGDLQDAMEWLARWFTDRHHLSVEVTLHDRAEWSPENIKVVLFQSVRELLFNVVKHGQTDTAWVRMEVLADRQICLDVADQGVGFDPRILSEAHSSGLGLFSVRERLEALGGGVEIDSRPNSGTRIRLILPADVCKLPREERAPDPAVGLKGPDIKPDQTAENVRVLLVDDHRIVRNGLAMLLSSEAGIEVVGEAADGIEAIQQVGELRPDVVLMDVSMPRMNGVDATRHITGHFPRTRVIGLSLHQESDMAAKMKEAGASDYFTKDGPTDRLTAAVLSALTANR